MLFITGTNLIITFFLLISVNGYFIFFKMPLLGIPIAGITALFLLGFIIDFSGINLILSLILLVFMIINLFVNIQSFRH